MIEAMEEFELTKRNCEQALRNGQLDELSLLNARLASRREWRSLYHFFASYYLPKRKAIESLLESIVANPGFQRAYVRIGELMGASDQERAALSARILPHSLVPESMKLPEQTPIEVSWRFTPDETSIHLPEPLGGLNSSFPIKKDDEITPAKGRACCLENAFLYWDGFHLNAFSEEGIPINLGYPLGNLPVIWAAVQRLLKDNCGILSFDAPVHVIGSPGPRSFYHWMVDICPQLGLSKEMFPELPVKTVCSNGVGLGFQNRMLELLAPDAEFVNVGGPTIVKSPKIVLGRFNNGLGKSLPEWTINFWRERRLKGTKTRGQKVPAGERPRRIFVARKENGGRALLPVDGVQKLMDQHHYRTVYLEELSLQEQFDTFAEADIIASAHGAGLTHTLFMEPHSVLVEIFGDHMTSSYRYLAGRRGVGYIPVSMKTRFENVEMRSLQQRDDTRFSDVEVDLDKLERALTLAESVYAERYATVAAQVS